MENAFETVLRITSPLPAFFMTDFGRYLFGAGLVTAVLSVVSRRFKESRGVRTRQPSEGQRPREFAHSVLTAAVFSAVGLGVYYGASAGIFHIYEHIADFGYLYWGASLLLIIVAHDAYFYWTHRLMHVRAIFPW